MLIDAGLPWTDRLRDAARSGRATAAAPSTLPDQHLPEELEPWRREVDPANLGGYARRLSLAGLDVADALSVVRGDRGATAAGHDATEGQPSWWPWFVRFRDALVAEPDVPGTSDLDWLASREAGTPDGAAQHTPFAALLWPGVVGAWSALADAHQESIRQLADTAAADLRRALLARLSWLTTPCLLAVLDEGIPFGERLLRQMSPVPDDPPRDRYARLCREQGRSGLESVLATYPVLASLIGTSLRQWHAATVELLERVDRDRAGLAEEFSIDASTPLTSVAWGAGDTHQDGRSVAVLGFGDARVVYKPRDVRLEAFWAQCIAALNVQLRDQGHVHEPASDLRAPRILARHEQYGYAEFIAHEPAADEIERARFYRHAGRTMALLLALSATDCHFENLIAHRDQLVLVDAEALFETAIGTRLPDADSPQASAIDSATVLQLGMLPTWMWLEGRREGYDITALGARPVDDMTIRALRAINTDVMSFGDVTRPAEHPGSLPTPPGVTPDLATHVEDLVMGFTEAYRALTQARDEAFASVLDGAESLRRRLIVRATYVYASLLQSSCQPEALTSAAARGMVLERLTRAFLLPEEESIWCMLVAEQEALGRLDVPLFEADLRGGVTRWLGGELEGWPQRDAVADVRTRVAGWDERDLARQVAVIRASVQARTFRMSTLAPHQDRPSSTGTPSTGTASAAQVARACLDRVRNDALTGAHDTTWMTLAMVPDGERVNVQVLGPSLYDGRAGLAAFCFAADAPDLGALAIDPLLDSLNGHDLSATRRAVVGSGLGLSGVGGYLRTVRFLADHDQLAEQRARATETALVRAVSAEYVARDSRLDLIGGAAGLISPLAALVERDTLDEADRAAAVTLLRAAADLLVQRQLDSGGWRTLPASAPITGLAHGASGIALALAQAARTISDERYLDAALRGLAYERSCYDPTAGNWPDYRATAGGGFMLGWCAGAPGIALARAGLIDLLPDHDETAQWREELRAAAATTAEAPLSIRDHLCCGNLGRAAILRTVATATGDAALRTAADRIVDEVLAATVDGLPRAILPTPRDGLSVPGLMTGLAGFGLMLGGTDPSPWVTALLR